MWEVAGTSHSPMLVHLLHNCWQLLLGFITFLAGPTTGYKCKDTSQQHLIFVLYLSHKVLLKITADDEVQLYNRHHSHRWSPLNIYSLHLCIAIMHSHASTCRRKVAKVLLNYPLKLLCTYVWTWTYICIKKNSTHAALVFNYLLRSRLTKLLFTYIPSNKILSSHNNG